MRRVKGEPEALGRLLPRVLGELGLDASARAVRESQSATARIPLRLSEG